MEEEAGWGVGAKGIMRERGGDRKWRRKRGGG